ncbi:hypothetical protein CHCC20335_2919 [Bacillus paralicheniformis]|nr:hypothetical protein CHCC20335_2919 [Bacillus paralicheniformis]
MDLQAHKIFPDVQISVKFGIQPYFRKRKKSGPGMRTAF